MLIRGITEYIIDIYNRRILSQAALRSRRAKERREGGVSPLAKGWLSRVPVITMPGILGPADAQFLSLYNGIRSVEREPQDFCRSNDGIPF